MCCRYFLYPSALRVDVTVWHGQPFGYHETIGAATLASWNWITTSIYLFLKTFYYLRKNKSIVIKPTAWNVGLCEAGSIPSSGNFFPSWESKLNISSHAFVSPIVDENTNGMDLRPDPGRLWENQHGFKDTFLNKIGKTILLVFMFLSSNITLWLCIFKWSIAVVFQSRTHVWPLTISWTAACQAPLSFTIFQSFLRSLSIELMV